MIASNPYDVCEQVRQVVEGRLSACERPVTTSYVAAGLVPWDDCCGTLTVAPERVYRTGIWPAEGPDPLGCYDGQIAVSIVVLLLRCVPVVDDQGRAPTVNASNLAYKTALEDAAIVWDATGDLPQLLGTEIAGQAQTYVGADGGCIGSETRLVVAADADRWCSSCP